MVEYHKDLEQKFYFKKRFLTAHFIRIYGKHRFLLASALLDLPEGGKVFAGEGRENSQIS